MVDSPPGSGSEAGEDHPQASQASARYEHRPVMLDEVVALIEPLPEGTFLDATLGGGGHAGAVLAANPGLDLVGIDRDPIAIAAATEQLAGFAGRFRSYRGRFDRLAEAFADVDGPIRLSGFLFDLGVSSPQLDRADRGFSYRNDGPLDMRMDPDADLRAATVVNDYDEDELRALIRRNSDERYAARIAAAIVAARPLESTAELAGVIAGAIPAPARRRGGHPATRTFQAIRIEVNSELAVLAPALEQVLDALVPGGRGLVITYHSGEDRITKNAFRARTSVDQPPGLPVERPRPDYEIVRPMVRRPSDAEVEANPRAASARLRAIERVAA